MTKAQVRVENLKANVEIAVNAAAPEVKRQIELAVRKAIKSFDLHKHIRREAQEAFSELFTEVLREEIREIAEDSVRKGIRAATAPVVEKLFREWLAYTSADTGLHPPLEIQNYPTDAQEKEWQKRLTK